MACLKLEMDCIDEQLLTKNSSNDISTVEVKKENQGDFDNFLRENTTSISDPFNMFNEVKTEEPSGVIMIKPEVKEEPVATGFSDSMGDELELLGGASKPVSNQVSGTPPVQGVVGRLVTGEKTMITDPEPVASGTRTTQRKKTTVQQSSVLKKPLQCPHCPRQYQSKTTLKIHHTRAHVNVKRNCTCSVCGVNFVDNFDLLKHSALHKGEKPYRCEICGNDFTRQSTLEQHSISQHENLNTCRCKICGKSFRHSESLKKHVLEHDREKRHKCNICGVSYKNPSELKEHSLKHTGDPGKKLFVMKSLLFH